MTAKPSALELADELQERVVSYLKNSDDAYSNNLVTDLMATLRAALRSTPTPGTDVVRGALIAADGMLDALKIFPENNVRQQIKAALASSGNAGALEPDAARGDGK